MFLAVLLPALPIAPAAAATEEERLECLGRLRRDLGTCLRDAHTRCRGEFEGRLDGCFSRPECPAGCLAAQEECRKPLLLERDGCRLACQADGRVAQRGCRVEVDQDACRRTQRVKTMKCRYRCNRKASPALQGCRNTFSECLRGCAAAP